MHTRILKYMESKKKSCDDAVRYFQMPLHYPRYTKKDYQDMPEAILDMLLAAYGLSPHGDLAYKRAFAMGAFLWTDFDSHSSANPA